MFYFKLDDDDFRGLLTQYVFADFQPHYSEEVFGINPNLTLIPAEVVNYGTRRLVLEKDTGSWCYLDQSEYDIYGALANRTLADVSAVLAQADQAELREFIARLYWLGLLEINGNRFIDPSIFHKGPISYPGALFIMVPTERCNLACRYCYAQSHASRDERMEFETAKRIVDLIMQYPVEYCTIEFAGGEAFLEPDLIERTVKYARECAERADKQVDFRAQSNGTLLNANLVKRMADLDVSIGLSLDGDRAANDLTRMFTGGKGTYDAIMSAIAHLKEMDRDVGVLCVVSRANYQRMDEIVEHLSSMDLDAVKLNPVQELGRARSDWDSLALKPKEFLDVHKAFLDSVLDEEIPVSETNTCHMFEILGTTMHPYRCMRSQCGAGRDFLTFSPKGNVFPCSHTRDYPEFCLGNVADLDRLDGIWRDNPHMARLAERKVDNISECRECSFKRFCEGGCSLSSYEHYGTNRDVHPWCSYYKGIYRELFRRIEQAPDLIDIFCPDAEVYDKSFFAEQT